MVGTAALVAALTWLIRSLLTHQLKKDVESFKAILTAEAARDLERYKAEMSRTATEFQIKFTALQAKRAEVLAEMYRLLVDAKEYALTDAALLTTIGEPMAGSTRNSLDKCRHLTEFINRNQLYLTRDTAMLAQQIASTLGKLLRDYWFAAEVGLQSTNEEKAAAALARLGTVEARKTFDDAVAHIENEFREMLGAA